MEVVEDSAQKLKYCQTKHLPRDEFIAGAYNDWPCLYPVVAIVVIIFLSIMPYLSPFVFTIVLAGVLAWILTVALVAWREDRSFQYREKCFQLDKEKELLEIIFTKNSGHVSQGHYTFAEIKAIIPIDEPKKYRIILQLETERGAWEETLAEFKSKTERDECYEALSLALELPIAFDSDAAFNADTK